MSNTTTGVIGQLAIGISPIGTAQDVILPFGFPHIHSEVAWSHFLAQHVGKQYTEGYVKAFYPPLDLLDQAQYDLLTKRGILTSEGAQLDGVGNIVGIDRELDNTVFLPFFGSFRNQQAKASIKQELDMIENLMQLAAQWEMWSIVKQY